MQPVSSEGKILTDERETSPNTLFLAFNQTSLRLRHLTQIIGYNFAGPPDGKPFHSNPLPSALPHPTVKNGYYFTLQSSLEGSPEYVSDLQTSNSPIWQSFDCAAVFPVQLRSYKGIVIRVWLRLDDEEIPITSWGVNFSGLVPISSKPSSASDFAPNTILFKLRGRYFTSYDNMKTFSTKANETNFVQLHHGVPLSNSETKPSYSVSFLSRLHGNKRLLRQLERKRENLGDLLKAKGIQNESKSIVLQKEIENLKIRICLLMEQLEIEMNKLRAIKLATDNQDSENQDKGIELLEGYQALNKYLVSLRSQEVKLHEENELLKDIVFKMKERRCHLLSQLPFVFPVETTSDDVKLKICGVALPDAESYEGFSDQSLSVALGHVAQLLVKIAFLINIPLKYPITLRGSLSSIADLTSTQLSDVETQFPLYTRGKEKEKLHFNYGVFLLNKNIAQLRLSCGLPTSNLRSTLQNVWSFLCSLHNKNSSQPRAFMPDTIVPPVILPASLRQAVQTPPSLLHHQTPRLPLNLANPQPRTLKSLPDTPSSPKLKLPKKISLEEEYFLGSTSDVESKFERQESDESHSDMDATSLRMSSPKRRHFSARKYELQRFSQNFSKMRQTSFSLDQGLNYIKDGGKGADLLRDKSLKSLQFTNIPSLASGSFPNLTSKGSGGGEIAPNSTEETPLTNLNEQTTQLLQSWHENDPSPYHSLVTGSSSSEKLESLDKKESVMALFEENQTPRTSASLSESKTSTSYCKDKANGDESVVSKGVSSRDEIMNCMNIKLTETVVVEQSIGKASYHGDNEDPAANHNEKPIEKNSSEPSEAESFQSRLVKEMGLSLSDFSLDEDSFLDDVASRTANLASQNCSFKLSFSRQSTQE